MRFLQSAYLGARGLRYAGWLALLCLLALSACLPLLRVDNRVEQWLGDNSRTQSQYAQFQELFGSDEFILLAYTGLPLFTKQSLALQLEALYALERVSAVRRVVGIPSVYRALFADQEPAALAQEFLGSPFYRRFLISEDGEMAALLVELKQTDKPASRRQAVAAVRNAAEGLRKHGYTTHLAGPPLLNVVLDDASARETARTFPPAVVLALVVLLLSLRSVRASIVAAACATLTVTATLGLMALLRQPLNMVTSALPALLWVLALANIVHIVHQTAAALAVGVEREAAIAEGLRQCLRPCALASLTTAVGFLSLCIADMAPVRQLGFFAACGMLISLAASLLVGPMLLGLLRLSPPKQVLPREREWPGLFTRLVLRRPRAIAMAAFAAAVAALLPLPLLEASTDPLAFLPQDSQTVQDYTAIGQRLTGYYSLEVVVETPEPWWTPESLAVLDQLSQRLEQQEGVARVLSPPDVLKKLNQWAQGGAEAAYELPADVAAAETLLREAEAAGGPPLVKMTGRGGKTVRLSALVNVMDSAHFKAIAAEAKQAIQDLPAPFSGYATGVVLQMVASQEALVRTQVKSFGLAFLIVLGCVAIGLRSWRYALLAALPNLLPVLCALSLMALLGITLNAATVMVASIAVGIAVDDTMHVLWRLSASQRAGLRPREAVRQALSQVATPMLVSTATACAGFAALLRSAFVPIAWFGLLAAIAMAAAVAADLLLTPALFLAFVRKDSDDA